jgi:hypothetical protein
MHDDVGTLATRTFISAMFSGGDEMMTSGSYPSRFHATADEDRSIVNGKTPVNTSSCYEADYCWSATLKPVGVGEANEGSEEMFAHLHPPLAPRAGG